MTVLIGSVLEGKYEVVRHIGEGAWGDVYEGLNRRVHKRVAIKILKDGHKDRTDIVERFAREARTATKIESAHVVQVYDAGLLANERGDERPYLVMEYLDGEDLGQRIKTQGALGSLASAEIMLQVARGLADAHEAEVLHRDIKPENIFIVKAKNGADVIKIVDFGISKLVSPELGPTSVTQTGAILGSPVYMSPEQARGIRQNDARSDVYSLGVVLYECLAGRTPFDAQTFNELMFKIALEDSPDVRIFKDDVDPDMAVIVARCLAREPSERVQSAQELADALVDWLRQRGENVPDWRRSSGGGTRTASSTAIPVVVPGPASLPRGATASGNTILRASLIEPAPPSAPHSSRSTPAAMLLGALSDPPAHSTTTPGKASGGHGRTATYVLLGCAMAAVVSVLAFGAPRALRSVSASHAPQSAGDTPAVPPAIVGLPAPTGAGVVVPTVPQTTQTTPSVNAAQAIPQVTPAPSVKPGSRAPMTNGGRVTRPVSPALPAAVPPPQQAAPAQPQAAQPAPATPAASVGGRAIQTEL